jgi:hypothetical protein
MAGESDLAYILTELLIEFDRRNVQYALAGGWAFSALVEPRATTDIDILILLDPPSRETIQSLVSSIFTSTIIHPAPMKLKGISIWRCAGIRDGGEIVLDLLLADSDFLRSALSRKRRISFRGQIVSILTLEDLMLMKMSAGRLQDKADLERIAMAGLTVDWEYVEQWKHRLGLGTQ